MFDYRYVDTIANPQSGPTTKEQWKAFHRMYRVLRQGFDWPNAQAHYQCLFWYDNRFWQWYWVCEYGSVSGPDGVCYFPRGNMPKELRRRLLALSKVRRKTKWRRRVGA